MLSRGTGKGILMIAAVLAWACATAKAQMPGGAPQQPSPSQQQQMPGQPGAPGTPGATTGLPQANPDQPDRT
ncbi:MAG TPA: hypothetical protein VMD55_05085, partial [Terracidiphilus sp.]|nr:hypothetical protein [Terracidiphilus sp.]